MMSVAGLHIQGAPLGRGRPDQVRGSLTYCLEAPDYTWCLTLND